MKEAMKKHGKWIAEAIKHPGALHKELGVPEGKKYLKNFNPCK